MSYDKAIQILSSAERQFEFPISWGHDLQTEHERYLTETYFKKAVFVYDWPLEIKAFYMRRNDDKKTVAAMDLIGASNRRAHRGQCSRRAFRGSNRSDKIQRRLT